jgi:hypothetical protein
VEATILVVQKTPNDVLGLSSASPAVPQDYIGTQLVLLRSPEIIGRALRDQSVKAIEFPEGVSAEQAVYLTRDALSVRRHADAKDNVLVVALKWPVEQEAKLILRAVLNSYQTFLDETYKSVSDRTLELILEAKRVLTERLEEAEASHQDFRIKNALLTFGPEQSKNQFDRLAAIDSKKLSLVIAMTELEGRLAWLEKALADKNNLAMVELKVNEWAARVGFEKLSKEERQNLDAPHAYQNYLKQELAETRSIELALDKLAESERERARKLSNLELRDDMLRNRVVQSRQLLESITKRLSEINLMKDFGGFEARIVAPPRVKKG